VRKLAIVFLFLPVVAFAAGADVKLDRANADPGDAVSLQRGAQVFVNYCLNCHSASSMRYNRLMDLGLTEQQVRDNLLLAGEKIGDTMTVALNRKDGKQWFGVVPPDLSVIARSRGVDWLYTYLRTFYRDPTTVTGWNNLAFPNVGMPHVLWQMQGSQVLKTEVKDEGGHKVQHRELVLEVPGTLSMIEYDRLVRDLVNYLAFMGEPDRTKRVQIGIVVLMFLTLLLVISWLLKRDYWKELH
jgi:ubiquinol-cytochrome c reductase cytochrome c1 subunit